MLTLSPNATLVAHQTNTISITSSGTTITSTYTENVYRDPTSNYSATCGSNCLTWILQVTNDAQSVGGNPASNDNIDRITASNFTGFLTDIGVNTNGVPVSQSQGLTTTGTQAPVNVERSGASPQGTGSNMRWDFSNSSTNNDLAPGQTSVLLEIETNSTQVTPGHVSVQDGLSASGSGFSPALPEAWVPALGVVGGGVVGLFALRRRRQQRSLSE